MVHKTSYGKGIKTCRLYSPFWYLCNKEANKDKFIHDLNSVDDASEEEDLKNQRRLCIRNNTLFGIRDVYDSMESIPTARSLLCTGPYHQYPVPLCLGLRLLRILDALNIRQYEFPTHVVHLVQQMYLSLTFEGNISPSISKLWNLRYLIVCRHMIIVESDGKSSPDLPTEIWNMRKLNHLQVMGSDLPHPPCEGSLLPNLLTLSDVSPQSCTKDILERIPKLKKLRIRIELAPDANEPLSCFDHISHLRELKILKCVIVCPKIVSVVVDVPLAPLSIFPPSLEKLTMSGSYGYAWKELSKISSLPKLKELKLQCYAFQGPKWEVHWDEFPALEFLFIEDIDLVQWKLKDYKYCFKNLERISVKHCYKLEKMPSKFGRNLTKIELVYCNPLVETSAKKLKSDREMNAFNHRLF
ncbi:PREDICTED: uncharacterized protein LOC105960272 [Erythranthe guttata]|uniref:uncharacterized protein LOC105960272 n=1 Tax=Erythranthe guttata TaxID=4155 RepID=UPI00064DE04C|nr:PREDICTED: uncharacterized protein LOC105960272 [Erythranthe guttata]|eukprot:XP_012839892.1 PREDICTED: uncharacterized protein LOC105960272 [Erythranthe guttata]